MKCMSCLGLVVRLNSFRGFNLAHRHLCEKVHIVSTIGVSQSN